MATHTKISDSAEAALSAIEEALTQSINPSATSETSESKSADDLGSRSSSPSTRASVKTRAEADLRQRQPGLAPGAPYDPARHFFQRARAQQRARQHEHRAHGQRRAVGEDGEERFLVEQAEQREGTGTQHRDDGRGIAFAHEGDEHAGENDQAEIGRASCRERV